MVLGHNNTDQIKWFLYYFFTTSGHTMPMLLANIKLFCFIIGAMNIQKYKT